MTKNESIDVSHLNSKMEMHEFMDNREEVAKEDNETIRSSAMRKDGSDQEEED